MSSPVPPFLSEILAVFSSRDSRHPNLNSLYQGFLVRWLLATQKPTCCQLYLAKRATKGLAEHAEFITSEPEVVHLGEQLQAAVNDHERVESLERELHLAHAPS
jgi:hypothetical protein